MTEKLRYVSGGLYLLSFILFLLGFCAPWWTYPDSSLTDAFGLWAECVRTQYGAWACVTLDLYARFPNPQVIAPPYQATQAMMCLALITYLVTLVLFIQWIFKVTDRFTLKGPEPIIAGLVAGVFTNIGVSVYYRIIAAFIGWSLLVAAVSGGFNVLCGIIILLYFKYRTRSEYTAIGGSTNA